jgi:hypothetical protein
LLFPLTGLNRPLADGNLNKQVRRSVQFGLSALLAIVSIGAPFAHTHDSGKAEEHLAREHFSVLHAHIPLPSKDAAVNQVDDSARRVDWFHFEHQKNIVLAEPVEAVPLAIEVVESTGWFEPAASDPLPEESPPRAISPRGPPSLFA